MDDDAMTTLFTFLFFAGATLSAGKFLQTAGLPADAIAQFAAFVGSGVAMWLTPNWLIEQTTRLAQLKIFIAVGGGILSAAIFYPPAFWGIGAAMLLSLALIGLIFALSTLTARREISRIIAAVLTTLLMISPLWTQLLLDYVAVGGVSGVELKMLAVWLSPLTMLGAMLPCVNFACLPEVYSWWLGSLCPLPTWWLAILSYAAPAGIIGIFTLRLGRIPPISDADCRDCDPPYKVD